MFAKIAVPTSRRSGVRSLRPAVWLLVSATLIAGCGSDEDAPLEFHQATLETAKTGDATALWFALPGSYQDDLDACVQSFTEKLTGYENIYDRSFELIGKLSQLLAEKKDFLLQSPALATLYGEHSKTVEKAISPAARLLQRLSTSPVGSSAKVKNLDVPALIEGGLGDVAKEALALLQSLSEALPDTIGGIDRAEIARVDEYRTSRVFVENVSEQSATLRIEVDGREPVRQTVVQVEGKWIPEALANRWATTVGKIRTMVAELELTEKQKFLAANYLTLFESTVDSLLAAKTQDEFDQRLAPLVMALRSI